MNDLPRRLQHVHGLAALCAALMLATVVLSAFMRLSLAGFGCEPWPACAAQIARDAAQGQAVATTPPGVTAARMAHRVVASMVLVLALTLTWTTLRPRPLLRREAALAAAILALTLGLAVLGVFTPGARAPAVMLGNLLGGFLTFALCARLAAPQEPGRAGLGGWAIAAALAVVLQAALGALVSRAHALPGPDSTSLQALHDTGAAILLPLLALLAALAGWRGRRRGAIVLALLVLLQAALALLAGPGAPSLAAVLLHNALAALTLALVVRLV